MFMACSVLMLGPEPDGAPVKHFVLDMEGVTDIDVTGAVGLADCRNWLASRGVELHCSRVRPRVAVLLDHYGLDQGRRSTAPTVGRWKPLLPDPA
jgi:anti-anti-sigma regulatory factor